MSKLEVFDHVVIGSGLAGLAYAIERAQNGRVAVLTKGAVSDSNTSWAQGGIAAAVGEADNWELHEEDTLIAGAGLNDPAAVRFLVQNAPAAIEWLQRMGTRFDQNGDDLSLGREGGHSRHRIVHHADRTGWEIERAMVEAVRNNSRITVYEHAFATELVTVGGRCAGVRVEIEGLGPKEIRARAVMLATGGCGRMYQHTTNPRVATGDGISLAAAVGAEIRNMEFMQFHPTTLYHPQIRSFLISEAVRGAGATLRNHLGRRFMYDYDPRLELAPRDVVARAIEAEMKKLDTWCVYLDTTHLAGDGLRHEFPMIYEKLAGIGIEMDRDWIPVVPAQHYSCGGVVTDLDGQTTVPGLFAAGEVTCTGVHGANRLASNSLLEALVFAHAAAKVEVPGGPRTEPADERSAPKAIAEAEAVHLRNLLRRTMSQHVGIVRTHAGLAEADRVVTDLRAEYDASENAPFSSYPLETRNLLVAAQYVVRGARARKENIGLHFNEDQIAASSPSPAEN